MSSSDQSLTDDDIERLFDDAVNEWAVNKSFTSALGLIERVIVARPELAEAWELKSSILGELERGPDALTAIDEALRLEPDNFEFLDAKARILAFHIGDYGEALRIARAALVELHKVRPRSQPAHEDDDDFWAVSMVYGTLDYALVQNGLTDEATTLRAEAESIGLDVTEFIEVD